MTVGSAATNCVLEAMIGKGPVKPSGRCGNDRRAMNAVRAVGIYGEIFERNVGHKRAVTAGSLEDALPFR